MCTPTTTAISRRAPPARMAIRAVDGKEIGGFGLLKRARTCLRMAVHGVVQVSHAGGTVPAWLLPRVPCQRVQ